VKGARRLHVVTNSEVECFRTCRARWGFAYAEKLRPLSKPVPLSFGTIYHHGAAEGWRAAWEVAELAPADRALRASARAFKAVAEKAEESLAQLSGDDERQGEVEEHRDIAQWAVLHYFKTFQTDLRLVPLAIEAAFDVPIPDVRGRARHLRHDGVWDLVLWDEESGTVLLQDHKTTGLSPDVIGKRLPLDTQMSGYIRALHQLLPRYSPGVAPWHGSVPAAAAAHATARALEVRKAVIGPVVFNVVRRARPNEPSVNLLKMGKKQAVLDTPLAHLFRAQEADEIPRGEVSSAACDTTAEIYERALTAQQLERFQPPTEKQLARLEQLRRKGNNYVTQQEFYRGPQELERWRQEQWVEARLMAQAEVDPSLRTRNPGACTSPGSPSCVYAGVCQAPDSPEARAEFRVADERHEEVSEARNGIRLEWDGAGEEAGAGAAAASRF
jgi:hypothetical protein